MRQAILFTLALAVFVQLTSQQGIPPAAVLTAMSSRMERIHHSFFHNIRLSYAGLGPKQQKAIENLAWAPPRLGAIFVNGTEVDINGQTGEDFLYMHKKMIINVNRISEAANSTWRVVGWTDCPAPGDASWPVPAVYTVPGQQATNDMNAQFKSDDFYHNAIVAEEDIINDSDFLRTLSLGEFGVRLENGLHFYFHQRFSAANSVGYRVQDASPVAFIDHMWDVPAYDWLGDFYSAHVSPTFWKIHGYVDNKMEQWRVANGYDRIYWTGQWEGGPMDDVVINKLFEAARIQESAASSDSSDSSDSGDSGDDSDGSTDYQIDNHLLKAMMGMLKKTRDADN